MAAWSWGFWVGAGVLGALGLWLLYRALLADRSRGRRRCPKCWYDMAGVPGLTCPECGRAARTEQRLFKTRRRPWRALGAIVVLALASALAASPHVLRTGVVNSLPTPILITMMWAGDTEEHAFLRIVAERLSGANTQRSNWERWMLARHTVYLIRDKTTATLAPPTSPPRPPVLLGGIPILGSLFTQSSTLDMAPALFAHSGQQGGAVAGQLQSILGQSADPNRRKAAAECLMTLSPFPEAVQTSLLSALGKDTDPSVRHFLLNRLPLHRIDPKLAVPVLAAALRNERQSMGFERDCLPILHRYGPDAVAAAPEVAELASSGPGLFSPAIDVLIAMGQDAVGAVCNAASTSNATNQGYLMQAIGGLGLVGRRYEPCVRDRLNTSKDGDVRRWAAWALGQMRSVDEESLLALEAALRNDPDLERRMTAYRSLCYAAGEERAARAGCEALAAEQPETRARAAVIVRAWGFAVPTCWETQANPAPTSTR